MGVQIGIDSGGMAGQGSVYLLNPETEKELPIPTKTDFVPVRCGDVLRVLTPGRGGWGDPLERESSKVLDDITLGLVSMIDRGERFRKLLAENRISLTSED